MSGNANVNGYRLKWIISALVTACSVVSYCAGKLPLTKDTSVLESTVSGLVERQKAEEAKLAKVDLLEQRLDSIDRNTQDLPAIKTDLAVLKNNVQRLVDKKP